MSNHVIIKVHVYFKRQENQGKLLIEKYNVKGYHPIFNEQEAFLKHQYPHTATFSVKTWFYF